MKIDYTQEFLEIIKGQDWLMSALRAVREVDLPDWYIAAGAIRNTIWNHLHAFPTTFHQKDIDVAYFDKNDINGVKEHLFKEALPRKEERFTWDVVNQVRAHTFKHSPTTGRQVRSTADSIRYWSETSTCIGVRLEKDDSFTICAPYGLKDLMTLVVRPIHPPFQILSLYQERVQAKNWGYFWPKLKIRRV